VYIQVTISKSHSLQMSVLGVLDEMFTGSKIAKRIYVAVLPGSNLSKFTLNIEVPASTVPNIEGSASTRDVIKDFSG
jgi:hypothetical protein